MDREEIEDLLDEVKSLREEDPDSIVYEDAEEKLSLLLYLYDLLQDIREESRGQVVFSDIEEQDFRYIRLKNALEELDMLGYINMLSFYVGGNGSFQISDLYQYQEWIEMELEKIQERITESELEIDSVEVEEVREGEEENIIDELENFCSFVEENGFKAFWDTGYASGEVREQPEEIGRCLLMAYLAYLGGYSAREVPSGSGRQDIIYIEDTLIPTIIETKVFESRNRSRYEEGIDQLKTYSEGQTETAYYVIFQKGELYENEELEENGLRIIQRCANIEQEAPTN